MSDLVRLETELAGRFPEAWVKHHLLTFRPAYFAAFEPDDVARHLRRLIALCDDRPVVVEALPEDREGWSVEVVGYDTFQFLSTFCMLLAIHGLAIIEAQVFTSDPRLVAPRPAPRPGRRPGRPPGPSHEAGPDRRTRIVDRFLVRRAVEADGPPDWAAFQAELTDLTRLLRADRFEEVHRRVIPRFVAVMDRCRPEPPALEPIELAIDPTAEEYATVVRVGAHDRFGFLSLTASALALCGVMIVQADVRTRGDRVDDTFRVTDRFGRRIEAEAQLRELRLSLILIEHYSTYLPHATNPEAALVHFSRFASDTMARSDWGEEYAALDRPEVLDALVRVLGESDFLWEDYLHAQAESFLPMIVDPGQWKRGRTPAGLAADRDAALAAAPTLDARAQALRQFRDREFFRAGVRSILGLSGGLEGFSVEVSEVAEALLEGADWIAREELASVLPRRADGLPVPSALLAMGKCGGRELGFGSDLELMLVYDDCDAAVDGSTGVGARFDRYVMVLRQVLAARRGGTFDVDFRLRPYGRAGSPSTALTGFTDYYRAGGPAWGYERQALIKLRGVAGDPALGREVEAARDRFVYGPEPFDLDACRRLRRLQVEQLVRGGTLNAKYSPGALVDVEYLVQALQIVHGGKHLAVRTTSTLQAIAALEGAGGLTRHRARLLRSAYRFFRTLIDALRVVHGDARDLTVPAAGSDEFLRLTRRLRRPDPARLQADLDDTLRRVVALWNQAERLLARPT
jgi:glutamate-ammonia-ligase adenylyltransferase